MRRFLALIIFFSLGVGSCIANPPSASVATTPAAITAPAAAEPALVPAPKPPSRAGLVERTLPNGLKIICLENHTSPVAIVQVHVRAGSIFEEEYLGAGISHLTEHLVHSSTTAKRTGSQSEELLSAIGADTNASTTYDETTYYIQGQAKDLTTFIDLLSDWTLHAKIAQKEFDREKSVVQREIEMGDAEPASHLWDLAYRTTFQIHPVQYPIIGYKDLFVKLTRNDVLKYYQRMYTPDHMVVVAVGDFNAAKTADLITDQFGESPRGSHLVQNPQEDQPQMGLRVANEPMDIVSSYMMIRFRTIPLSHPDLYALDVLSYILTNGTSSRLYQRLHEKEPLLESVDAASLTPATGAGTFDIITISDPDNVPAIQTLVHDELARIKATPVTAEELERAKKQFIAHYVFARQSIEDQASDLATNYLTCNNVFLTEFYLHNISQVTAEQIQQVARRYFTEANETICVVHPTEKAREHNAAATQHTASPVEKITLPNGLRVLIQKTPGTSTVAINAAYAGGLLTEPADLPGLSNFYATMLTRGTATRSAIEISKSIDDIGATLDATSGRNTCSLHADLLASDFRRGFDLFADCLLNPAFPQDEIDKTKELFVARQKSQGDDLYVKGHLALMSALFQAAPYSRDPLGTPQSIRKINQKTLLDYHRRLFATQQTVIIIFGDIDPAQVKQLVIDTFGKLPKTEASPVAIPKPAPIEKDITKTQLTAPGLEAAMLEIAYPTCDNQNTADATALAVLDVVMSGTDLPSGWLHNQLRSKGLVYVVHAVSIPGVSTPGWFEIYAQARPEKMDEVTKIIDKNIEHAKTTLVTPDELQQAKQKLIAAQLLGRQTNDARGEDAALNELYGFGYNYDDSYAQRINAVTAAEVQRVAQKYFTHRATVIIRSPNDDGN